MTVEPREDWKPPAIEVGEPSPWAPGGWDEALERLAARPLWTGAYLKARARYTLGNLAAAAPLLALRLVPALLFHVRMVLVGLVRVLAALGAWRRRDDWLDDIKAAEGPKRARHRELFEKRKLARSLWLSGAAVVLTVAGLVAAGLGFDEYVLAVLLAVVVGLDAIGHRSRRSPEGDAPAKPPSSPLREGMSARAIADQVAEVLAEQGHDAAITDRAVGEWGVTMRVHSAKEVTNEHLLAVERGLQSFPGGVSQIRSAENAAVTTVRVLWADPLARSLPPPARPPLSESIGRPADLGVGIGGQLLRLRLLRTNVGIVGGPGAGKTMAFSGILDYLTACSDVVVDGIDLKGGRGLHAWGDCVRRVATDKKDAKDILSYGLDLAVRRTKWLGEQSRPMPGRPPREDNWLVSDGPAYVVIVDELPLLAGDSELLELYLEYLRIGREAAATSVWSAQDLTGATIGETALRKYVATMVLMACSREDVVIALGGQRIKEGWAPHRLIPATDEDINDAGKAYVYAGSSRLPEQWRFWRTSPDEVHRRAVERIAAGGFASIDGSSDAPLDAVVVPADLAVFTAAFEAARWPDWLPTMEILRCHAASAGEALDERTLAEMAGRHGFAPDPVRHRVDGKPRRGYAAVDVRKAMDRLPA